MIGRAAAASLFAAALGCAAPEAIVPCRPGDGLLVGVADPPALEWRSPRTGRLVERFALPAAPAGLAVTPRSSIALAALPEVDLVATFDLAERAPGPRLELPAGSRPIAVAAQRSGAALALAAGTGELLCLSLGGGVLWRTPVGPAPRDLALDRRAGRAYVLGGDGGVRVIDARRGELVDTLVPGGAPLALALEAPTGALWLAGARLSRWETSGAAPVALASPAGPFERVALDPAARRVAARAAAPPRLAVLAAPEGRLLWERPLEGASGPLLLDPWARTLCVASPAERGVRVLDAESGEPRGLLPVGGAVTAMLWIHEDLRAFPFHPFDERDRP